MAVVERVEREVVVEVGVPLEEEVSMEDLGRRGEEGEERGGKREGSLRHIRCRRPGCRCRR